MSHMVGVCLEAEHPLVLAPAEARPNAGAARADVDMERVVHLGYA